MMEKEYDRTPLKPDMITILIVDDSIELLAITSKYLSAQGMCTDTAENGQEGLQKYLASPEKYNAVLLDIQMPELNGYEFLRNIRGNMKETGKRIPVIAMSGDHSALEEGCFDYFICKPFKYSDLLNLVLTAIKGERGDPSPEG